VFPYLRDAPLDPEDSVTLEDAETTNCDIAIVALPHISNLSDFRLLANARRVSRPIEAEFACVILPGTKNTIGDLAWLRETGLDEWVLNQHRRGATVIGVCGGYQIMGDRVDDPLALESNAGGADGLGLLPVRTVMASNKVTRPVKAMTPSGVEFDAYEIHHGLTTRPCDALAFATLADGVKDGIRLGRCVGTYLHGALEDARVLSELLQRNVAPMRSREDTYEALADWFDANVDGRRFEELYLCS
jgi:adenosylcobyric acid synthase